MRYLIKSLPYAIVAAGAIAAFTPAPASALVNTCSAAAAPGCTTLFGNHHTYIESRSSKTGGSAAYVCTSFLRSGAFVDGACANNGTFIRDCYYGPLLTYGSHYGSSSEWTVDGRDATASDANIC